MEVQEVVASLAVPSGAERQCLEGLGLHGFPPVFAGVDILSKLKGAMLGELDRLVSNHGSQAKRSIYAIFGGEAVDPERHGINKIAHEDTWVTAIYSDQFRVH